MLVCIDKITCARMYHLIEPRWRAKAAEVRALIPTREAELAATTEPDAQLRLVEEID